MKAEDLLIPAAIVYVGYTFLSNVKFNFDVTPTLNVNPSLFGGSGSPPIDWSSVLPKTDWGLFSSNSSGGWTSGVLQGVVEGFSSLASGGGGFRNTELINTAAPPPSPWIDPFKDPFNPLHAISEAGTTMNNLFKSIGIPTVIW